MRTSVKILSAFATGLFVLAGCSASTDQTGKSDTVEGYAQGLTILEAQPGASFSAAFVRGSELIYLQAARGRETPQEYQQDPSFPKFEVDARIMAADGRIIYLRRGGDSFVDPVWAKDLEVQEALPPATQSNKALMGMVAVASASLEAELAKHVGGEQMAELGPEVAAILEFGQTAPAIFAEEEAFAIDRQKALKPPSEVAYGTNGPEDNPKDFGAGWYYIAVHDKGIAWDFGRHSATRIHKHDGSGWFALYDFCNHGTCAGSLNQWGRYESMGQKCSLIGTNKPAWTALTCSTGYDWDSEDGGHNCHDDTRVQLAAFVYGPSMARNQYWCNDGDSDADISVDIWGVELDQDGSPECDASTNRGYNHQSMYQYSASNTNSAQQNTANYTIQLAAGATYTLSTCGTSSNDTYLRLVDGFGTLVASNDDACGLQSTITVTPATAGAYTIRAGCFSSGSCNGKINVTLLSSAAPPVTAPPPPVYSGSCFESNACGGFAGSCWCDEYCLTAGDCCADGPC